ncbi:uncharacterized protein LOC143298299 [Babylonia areolata]|uniref:uncharacterized protein LOC143298299 n=1 Tax=Babylonia areolata TaxID=304850 RepID=UPI003FD39E11
MPTVDAAVVDALLILPGCWHTLPHSRKILPQRPLRLVKTLRSRRRNHKLFGLRGCPASVFSGVSAKETDTTYDLWRYEVECLKAEDHKEHVVLEAVRRSLWGEAARVAMRLGTTASLSELLSKFESICGVVQAKETLMASFYSAHQDKTETVSAWGCRIEDLWTRAMKTSKFTEEESREALRKFWDGLRQDLKDRSGHKYDTIKDFDDLRRVLRELELDANPKKAEAKVVQSVDGKELQALRAELRQLKAQLSSTKHTQPDQRQQPNQSIRNQSIYGQSRSTGQGTPPQHEVKCYRCGQLGHIKKGCRVQMLPSHPLNGQGFASRGSQQTLPTANAQPSQR